MRRFPAVVVALLAGALAAAGPAAASGDPLRSQQWGLDMIEADAAHQVSTGAGATVAVVDTGVDAAHPDLAGRLLPGHDFVDNDSTPQDDNGHGTHVTGIIAADAGNSVGIEGVAPEAKILPLRALDASGNGTSTDIANAIDYAVAHGAQVINLSLGDVLPGSVVADQEFNTAIGHALDAGVVVVAAAGNDGLPVCEQPSGNGRLLCVGAVDKRGLRSFYSSFGLGVGVMAPGGSTLPLPNEDVLSTWNDGSYQELAGTSQATPHVAGVAALLVSLGLRGQAVVDRIAATAKPGNATTLGAGIVDARAAVAGLGSAGAGSGAAGGGAAGGVSTTAQSVHASAAISSPQRIRAVLRRGVRVRCHAGAEGVCRVTVKARRRTIATGSHRVRARQTVAFYARLTKAGRRLLKRAGRLNATAVVVVPAPARFGFRIAFRR